MQQQLAARRLFQINDTALDFIFTTAFSTWFWIYLSESWQEPYGQTKLKWWERKAASDQLNLGLIRKMNVTNHLKAGGGELVNCCLGSAEFTLVSWWQSRADWTWAHLCQQSLELTRLAGRSGQDPLSTHRSCHSSPRGWTATLIASTVSTELQDWWNCWTNVD